MAPAGFVYVPEACRAVGAFSKLHFSFHGCGVNEYYDEAVHHLSFQRWAEANGRRPPLQSGPSFHFDMHPQKHRLAGHRVTMCIPLRFRFAKSCVTWLLMCRFLPARLT